MSRKPSETGSEVRRLIDAIIEIGPRSLKDLSKVSGISYSKTVRLYHKIFRSFGLKCTAAANLDALNLVSIYFSIRPSTKYKDNAFEAFATLRSLARIAVDSSDPSSLFGLMYVPGDFRGHEYLKLFPTLKDRGIITDYSTRMYTTRLRYGLMSSAIDWNTGRYAFDWSCLPDRKAENSSFDLREAVADLTDLLIIKELELDAAATFPEIRKNIFHKNDLNLSERLLLYHFSEHVVRRKMLSRYRVYFPTVRDLWVYVEGDLLQHKAQEYTSLLRSVPFLNVEYLNNYGSHHLAVFSVPPEHYSGFTANFLTKASSFTRDMKVRVAVPGMRYWYTIPFELFNQELGTWVYDHLIDSEVIVESLKKQSDVRSIAH
ncbi:MAG: hypothetical protein M1357_01755 [Candidatus Marsarchaeota archaeon]|nr:hypothetical protein [Candidatus Marsarchaeota archaeon]